MPTRRTRLAVVGKIPTTAGAALDLLVEPLERVGAADPAAAPLREGEVAEQVGLRLGQQLGHARVRAGNAVDHPVELLPGRGPVGLLEDRADRARDHAPRRARHEVLGVAGEVHPAPLPPGAEQLLVDGPHEARVVVGHDEPHPVEPALHERPDEARPGGPLVVAGAELEPEHAALPRREHADRHERRHGHDPAGVADLRVRRVGEQVRAGGVRERARAERLDLVVERGADPARLAPRERRDPERLDEVLDPAGGDPLDVRLGHDREERPLGAPARLQQAREARAVAHPRHRQADRADPRVPAPLPVPVAVGQPRVRVALAARHPRELRDLRLASGSRTPSRRKSASPSLIALRTVSSTAILSSAIVASPRCRRLQIQRREDDAAAALVHGPAVTPSLGTRPARL